MVKSKPKSSSSSSNSKNESESNGQKIQLYISDLSETYPVKMSPTDKLTNLVYKIKKIYKKPGCNFKLIHDLTILKGNKTLESYGIKDNDCIIAPIIHQDEHPKKKLRTGPNTGGSSNPFLLQQSSGNSQSFSFSLPLSTIQNISFPSNSGNSSSSNPSSLSNVAQTTHPFIQLNSNPLNILEAIFGPSSSVIIEDSSPNDENDIDDDDDENTETGQDDNDDDNDDNDDDNDDDNGDELIQVKLEPIENFDHSIEVTEDDYDNTDMDSESTTSVENTKAEVNNLSENEETRSHNPNEDEDIDMSLQEFQGLLQGLSAVSGLNFNNIMEEYAEYTDAYNGLSDDEKNDVNIIKDVCSCTQTTALEYYVAFDKNRESAITAILSEMD